MKTYDIGIGWADPVERTFVEALKKEARARKKTVCEITLSNLTQSVEAVRAGALRITTYLDRGFLESYSFTALGEALEQAGCHVINSPRDVLHASSKADLFPRLAKAGLPLPRTHIVNVRTPRKDLDRIARELGKPFVVVSSYGLGDKDSRLLLGAETGIAVRNLMDGNYADDFLAHEFVQPGVLEGKTAWFRPIYAAGKVLPLWWDPLTCYYQPFSSSAKERTIARTLEGYMRKIHDVTGLELFSSEFAQDLKGKLVLIDYANTPIDLNSSEKVAGGLPPETIAEVARTIVGSASR